MIEVNTKPMVHVQSESSDGTIAKLVIKAAVIRASTGAYHQAFVDIIKQQRFRWYAPKRHWQRPIDDYSGPVSDRLLEVATKLLAAGLDVYMTADLVVRLKVGDWQPEQRRWIICVGEDFGIRWRGKNDNLYAEAKLLPSARWDTVTKAVVVPALHFAEVEGFAEEHDFRFHHSAQKQLEQIQRDYQKIILPEIPQPQPAKRVKKKAYQSDPTLFLDIPKRQISTTTSLFPYQQRGVDKLLPLRIGALFMEMGLGKTRCAIELVAQRQQRVRRVVWFCPVGLKWTIAAEIEKHTRGEAVYVFDDETTATTVPQDTFWHIVGIESLSSSDRVVVAARALIDSDTFAIVDESSYIKGHAALRTLRLTEMCQEARYRLILTGTPISQGYEDLFAQMRFLSSAILGYSSFYAFANNHLEYSADHPGMITRSHNTAQISTKIDPYVYQITKAECLDLPDKLYDTVHCQLTPQQWGMYQQVKYEMLSDLDEIDSYTLFLLFTYLQEIVSGYLKKDGETVELPENRRSILLDVVSRLPEDERIIIWCKYVYSVHKITRLLPASAMYYGKLNIQQRKEALEKFRSGERRILVATQATGGHGLTLNEAHYHIFYENEFKYANRLQAEDRSHRIGQERHVTYIDIVSNAGIDRRIQEAIRRKQNVVEAFKRELRQNKQKAGVAL